MKTHIVESGLIYSVSWEDKELFITFKNNQSYLYKKVPKKIYKEFINSDSKGSYFSKNIRNQYDYIKIS